MDAVDWPERDAFFARIDELKAAAGFRHDSAVSEAAGFVGPLVEHWRSGRRKPSLATVSRVAEVLGVPPADLAKLAGLPPVEAVKSRRPHPR
jgi:hypothetical protein